MFTKWFIIIILIGIVVALFSGLIFLVRDDGKSKRTVKALTWRIALSLGLFMLLLLGFVLGLISPHSI